MARANTLFTNRIGIVDVRGDPGVAWADLLMGDVAWRSNGHDLSEWLATSSVDTVVFHVDAGDPQELVQAIDQARSLKPRARLLLAVGAADALVLAELISVVHPPDSRVGRGPALTARESQVLQEIRSGCTNREIAGSLGISISTVNRHVESILKKLSARNRAQAVAETEMLRRYAEVAGNDHELSLR